MNKYIQFWNDQDPSKIKLKKRAIVLQKLLKIRRTLALGAAHEAGLS